MSAYMKHTQIFGHGNPCYTGLKRHCLEPSDFIVNITFENAVPKNQSSNSQQIVWLILHGNEFYETPGETPE